jgi:hypothetical protein
MGRRSRYRPVNLVLDEIEMLVRQFGVDEVQIVDDLFTRERQYVMDFCEGLAKRGLNIPWACPYGIRISSIDEELVRTMNRAGCYMVSLGIESASDRILELMNKKLSVEETEEKVQLLRSSTDMLLQGFFMLGYPTETAEEMKATIEFARRLPLDMALFSTLRLTPGAEVLELARSEGWANFSWESIDIQHVHYHPKTVTAKELASIRAFAYRRFYSTPARVAMIFRRFTSWRIFKHVVWTGFRRFMPAPQV